MKLVSIAFLAIASLTSFGSAYPVQKASTVNCRSGPNTSSKVVRKYKRGANIKISCQIAGQKIYGNSLWDKTQHGCYIADYYVKTGKSGYITKKCGGGSSKPGGSGGSKSACNVPNAAGLKLIKEFEGFVPRPAPDPIGLPTVGYGHLCKTKGCREVPYKFPLTKTTGDKLLRRDIPSYTGCLSSMLKSSVKLNQNQWAALTSWVFNIGCGNAKSSSLIRRLNAGNSPNTVAAQELPKWKLAGGRTLPGLVRRRNAEIKLFKTPTSNKAFPKCG